MPESKDERLAREFLLGSVGPKGRVYLKPNSIREKKARKATARVLRKEAGPDGYFTCLIASLIDPSPNHVFINRKIIFQRPRGTPVVASNRQRAEIAAFIHNELEKQKAGAPTAAQARNLKLAIGAASDKFGYGDRTLREIWKEFKPVKPTKSTANK
jgi:hypothetical protein